MKFGIRISDQGFSLLELIVAMGTTIIVMASIGSTFYSQQKSYSTQEQVASMQQNIRAAMYYMEREIRMAGYDPVSGTVAGIQNLGWEAGKNRYTSVQFTMDIDDDAGTGEPDGDIGDDNEDITYSLSDDNGDGDDDLMRNNANGAGGDMPVAENIDALDFVYLDQNGDPTTTITEIRSIQISLVARTGKIDPGFTNSNSYTNQQGTTIYTAPGDHFRRRLLTAQVKCRNLGLE